MDNTALEDEVERLKKEVESLRAQRDEATLAEARLRKENDLLQQIMNALPIGVSVIDTKGQFLLYNRAIQQMAGLGATDSGQDGWSEAYGLLREDGETPYPPEELPLSKALLGESVDNDVEVLSHPKRGRVWVCTDGRPLRDETGAIVGAVSIIRDMTQQRALEQELSTRNAALEQSEAEKTGLIARLRVALRELSTPILEVWDDVLTLPVIGVVDSQRSGEMTARLLEEVSRSRAKFVIIDLTGVDTIDTGTADRFIKLARSVELLGSRCVLTGIQPSVAQALASLDAGFGDLTTLQNLKHALRACMRSLSGRSA
jgi:rsbT co-antagonist protein RsbR